MIADEKRLVFISGGDHHQIHPTLNERDAPFDILVSFYGASASVRTELEKRRISVLSGHGSKFQNLRRIFSSNPRLFDSYDAVFVLDDDLSLAAGEVARLFDFRQQHDFWIVQPAFQWGSSLGDQYSRCNPLLRYRYTNFVEVNAPLFRADKLKQFIRIYDGSLVGWGIDFWYMNLFEEGKLWKFAICDEVSTVNPFSRRGVGWREIDQLQGAHDRKRSWDRVRRQRRLKQIVPVTYPGPRRSVRDATRETIRLAWKLFTSVLRDRQVRKSEWPYLKGATKRLLRDLGAGVTARVLRRRLRTGNPTGSLRLLTRVWGNAGFRASEHFVRASIEASSKSKGSVLQLGAGLTTLAMSASVGNDRAVIAVEQDAAWARRLKRRFLLAGARNVELMVGSLDFGESRYHRTPRSQLPNVFGVVALGPHIIDSSKWSDEIPDFIAKRLDENTAILVDSVEKRKSRMLAISWAERLDRKVEIHPKKSVIEKYASLVPHAIEHTSDYN